METYTCHSYILNMKTKLMNRDMFGSEPDMNTSTEQKETITDTLSQGATLKMSENEFYPFNKTRLGYNKI